MRSTNFLTFFILALLSVLQLSFAEPLPADSLVERETDLDIAPTSGGFQQSFENNEANKSEKHVCPWGARLCPNKRCCKKDYWCYAGGCCPTGHRGCGRKGCCAKGWNCCKEGKCCPPGHRCIWKHGKVRCCPHGKRCGRWDDKENLDANGSAE
ncbi:hypothetical protein FS749_014374 [Ceratobasidium sp. UAMH 11750]|nr:hypothetical protein FS749_014374 [Ceratobasidium sp. UAMH 11750]